MDQSPSFLLQLQVVGKPRRSIMPTLYILNLTFFLNNTLPKNNLWHCRLDAMQLVGHRLLGQMLLLILHPVHELPLSSDSSVAVVITLSKFGGQYLLTLIHDFFIIKLVPAITGKIKNG